MTNNTLNAINRGVFARTRSFIPPKSSVRKVPRCWRVALSQ
jgi:hypothetical protein